MCFKETQVSLEDSDQVVMRRFCEFKQAFKKLENIGELNHGVNATSGWNPPPRGFIKVNFDAAVRGANSFLGVVARNEDVDVIEARVFLR